MKASGDGAIFHQYLQIHIRTTFIHPKTGRKQQKPFHLSISKFENTSDLLIEIHPLPPRNLEGKGLFPYRGRGVAVILIWRPLVNDPFEVITCAASRFPPPIRVRVCVVRAFSLFRPAPLLAAHSQFASWKASRRSRTTTTTTRRTRTRTTTSRA